MHAWPDTLQFQQPPYWMWGETEKFLRHKTGALVYKDPLSSVAAVTNSKNFFFNVIAKVLSSNSDCYA